MAQAIGSKARIIYDSETTYKTTPGSPDAKILPFVSESIKLQRNLIESKAIKSSRNPNKPGRGNIEVAGDISLEINPFLGTILRHALGASTPTGVGPYTHTIKINNLPVGLTIEKGFTDLAQYFLYNGCRINKLSMGFKSEGIIDGSIGIIGAKETVSGTSFDATPVDYTHKPFDGFEASIQEGGSAIATVSELNFDLENNLDGVIYTIGGAGERKQLPEGMVKVSGNLKALFDSLTLYNKAIGHTETSIKLTLSRGNGLGSADNESLEIFIPELVYKPQTPVVAGPAGIFIELPFEAYYDNASEASTIQMILKNSLATI